MFNMTIENTFTISSENFVVTFLVVLPSYSYGSSYSIIVDTEEIRRRLIMITSLVLNTDLCIISLRIVRLRLKLP